MTAPITHDQWTTVRNAVRETGDRFAAMVSSARAPETEVTPGWSLTEIAAHVTVIAWLYTAMVRPGETPIPIPALADRLPVLTVDTIDAFNDLTLLHFTERDPRTLAGLLRSHIDHILRVTGDLDPARPVPWLGDSRVPVAGVVAHLLNELLIHGHDMAPATGTPWPIPPGDAAMFFELFLLGVVRCDAGRLLETGKPVPNRRIAVEFRSAHTSPVTLVLERGRVSAEEAGRGADVRVSFDPAAFNLMMFGRISRPRAVLTGKVTITGPRPWLLPAFLRVMHMP